jgi:hypothetical protein
MSRTPLHRRTLLRGAFGAGLALPWLEVMETRAQTAPPKRFIAFFTPNGNIASQWKPSGTETAFTLSPILAPLEAYKSKLLVLSGLNMKCAQSGPGELHMMGMGGFLTGAHLQSGSFTDGSGTPAGWADGISVDQQIAKNLGAVTRFPSLELGVQVVDNTNWGRMSYLGPGLPATPENDPTKVYSRLFSSFTPPTTGAPPPQGPSPDDIARRSILDLVKRDLERLGAKVGVADKRRLDAHLAALRSVENQLASTNTTPPSTTSSCVKPTAPTTANVLSDSNYPAVGKAQLDLLAMAFACDLTRVASVQWSYSRSATYFPWLGISSPSHHSISHDAASSSTALDKAVKINTWYMEQLAYLMGRLASMPEGNGTVLDNTIILVGNELANGQPHEVTGLPLLLAGGGAGYFRMGRFLQYSGTPHNNLLVSCLNALGSPVTTFGYPEFCTGPLSGLT